jgi:hypothetical protein
MTKMKNQPADTETKAPVRLNYFLIDCNFGPFQPKDVCDPGK